MSSGFSRVRIFLCVNFNNVNKINWHEHTHAITKVTFVIAENIMVQKKNKSETLPPKRCYICRCVPRCVLYLQKNCFLLEMNHLKYVCVYLCVKYVEKGVSIFKKQHFSNHKMTYDKCFFSLLNCANRFTKSYRNHYLRRRHPPYER